MNNFEQNQSHNFQSEELTMVSMAVQNLSMFKLPNKPELTAKVFLSRAEELNRQYEIANKQEN